MRENAPPQTGHPGPEDGPAGASPQPDGPPPARRRLGPLIAPLAIFAALAAVFALALATGDPSRLPSALIGRPAPDLALAPVDGLIDGGRPVPGLAPGELAQGRPTVVNFWASWCAPCVEEHPQLMRLKQRTDATLVGINYKDQAANARRFLARYGNPFASVGSDRDGRVAIEWGVYGMPETFVVDGRGRIVFKHVGPLTPELVELRILPAIEQAKAAR